MPRGHFSGAQIGGTNTINAGSLAAVTAAMQTQQTNLRNPLPKQHKELVHYTTSVGLHGIVTSKTLWASHTSCLNDSEEVAGFFDRVLAKLLREPYERCKEVRQQFEPPQVKPPLEEDQFQCRLNKIVHAYRRAETRSE